MGNHATPPEPPHQLTLKRMLWPLGVLLVALAFLLLQMPDDSGAPTTVSYSEIKTLIRNGDVREVTLEETSIMAVLQRPMADGPRRVRAVTPQQADPSGRVPVRGVGAGCR